jgi:hypothetical protein
MERALRAEDQACNLHGSNGSDRDSKAKSVDQNRQIQAEIRTLAKNMQETVSNDLGLARSYLRKVPT